ncbi:MAG: hypothetical protein KDA77_16700 [Planctomycetaceae bacterium]|nr:hypothetical protein [Planctomycetaceae bacterium]
MAKKYLNLEEAAAQLGMDKDELNRLREAGDIRGFADRGAWKFRLEDVEELGRSRQADSDPAIPLFTEDEDDDDLFGSAILEGDELGESVIDEDEVGEQATVIRGSVHDDDEPVELSSSDSDVRLVVDDGDDLLLDSEPELIAVNEDSDSDVRLTDDSGINLSSDSDVKLVDADSEPEFDMLDLDSGSDSDVKLVADDSHIAGSESDVALISDEDFDLGSDSDVALVSDESHDSSILAEDSGISLASDSGISLAGPLDSGISLEAADESGISLVDDDASGISLEDDTGSDISITADSGISLEPFDVEDVDKTVPMMSTDKNATLEIPSLDDDEDSSFDLSDSSADTSVLMLGDDETGGSSGSVILDSDEEDSESAMFEDDDDFASDDAISDVFDEDEDEDDFDDIYDADDDDFEDSFQSGESHAEFVAPAAFGGRGAAAMAAPEPEWGAGTFTALIVSTLLMLVCSVMMYDLIRTMWHYDDPSSVSSALLDTFGGLF